ncbi:MAG: TolC family protein [Deltaproteobacteria bacterium]|nr:TolC family protein [Deltaproteobacteria bacterium]
MNLLLRIVIAASLFGVCISPLMAQTENNQTKIISLYEAIKVGLSNSYSVEIQNEKTEQALSLQRKALALLLPQLTAQGTYTRYEKEVEMQFPELESLEIINVPPYIKFNKYQTYVIQKENSFGALVNLSIPLINIPSYLTYKNAKDSVRISELSKENQKAELIYNISQTYLNTVSIKKSVAITRNSIELATSHLKTVETKLKNGDANELSLIKARLDMERAQNDYEKMQKAYKIAIESLAVLLNTEKNFDVEDSPKINTTIPQDTEELFRKALSNRYDIKILSENNKIIERDISITKSKFLPTLNMNATYRYSDMTSFLEDETQWFVIFSLNLSLYDGGIRYAEMREKKSKQRENNLLMKQLTESVKSQINQSLEEIKTCKNNISSLEKQLELAKKSYELSVKSYSVGVISQSDLIDSEIAVTNTELLLEKEKNDCLIQYIKLLKNTGEINSFEGR